MKHKIGNSVTVHQYTALVLGLDLSEGKSELFAALCTCDVGNIYSLVGEEILNICAELIVGNLADKSNLLAQTCKTDCNVCRRTADIFFVIFTLVKSVVIIRRVKVDRNSADRDQVKLS